ncbi:hypothetical protein SRS16P2_00484 (plasmid) [Variovorax sp. SRS16]|nr:hypothetical protein SRS16P2_00484 [Variovorax sp. SRS16]
MNGQRILQALKGTTWAVEKVSRAQNVKPGFYNLHEAKAASKAEAHEGTIIHSDEAKVYQSVGRAVVFHARADFSKLPEIGANLVISYDDQSRAVVTPALRGLKQSRSAKI